MLAAGVDFLVNFDGAKAIGQHQATVSSFLLVRLENRRLRPRSKLKAHNTISVSTDSFVYMKTKPNRNHG